MLKLSLLLLSIFVSLQSRALICQDLFLVQQQTQFAKKETPLAVTSKAATPFEVVETIQHRLQEKISQTIFSGLPEKFKFAIAYAREENIHVVSDHLSAPEHQRLLKILEDSDVFTLVSQIPFYLRNKYFEVSITQSAPTSQIELAYKFANDLSFPIKSQFITGFAQTDTNKIRRYNPELPLSDDHTIVSLQNQKLIQDTLATCGLASVCKVLAQRNILYNEKKMLELTQSLGIRSLAEVLGPNPGLEFSQLVSVLSYLGQQLGFSVRQIQVQKPEDVNELKRLVQRSVDERQIDLIINYSSPAIGRPGGGHYSPVAGYNAKTTEILLNEVNTALNPAFWLSAEFLTQAMLPTETAPHGRGYIVIQWQN